MIFATIMFFLGFATGLFSVIKTDKDKIEERFSEGYDLAVDQITVYGYWVEKNHGAIHYGNWIESLDEE